MRIVAKENQGILNRNETLNVVIEKWKILRIHL